METSLSILSITFYVLCIASIVISVDALYRKTKELKNGTLKRVRILDIPSILAIFVVSFVEFENGLRSADLTLWKVAFFIISSILFVCYLILVIGSLLVNRKSG